MRKYQITFVDEQISFSVETGKTVLQAQIDAGLTPDAFCGGTGKCGKCKVVIDGKEVLACQTVIDRDMTIYTGHKKTEQVQILTGGSGEKLLFQPGELPGKLEDPLLGAVDVGSTSVVVYLMDGKTGELLGTRSALNPQRQFGADVVNRCSYAMENGSDSMSSCIRNTVNTLFRETARECGRVPEEIVRVVMVGNSCMHHLFLGISTKTLALAPYTPAVTEALELKAADYDLHVYPGAQLWWLPNIGGFVGADTVGCLVASDLDTCEEMTLLVDIGTNGELVLGNREGLISCSTAAGPAFEGAKITCGMRGSTGAIDHVSLENGEIKCHVIGDGEASGICGSGLLDGVAALLKLGKIDETGRMEETCYLTDRVFLNQRDIRELQLAKAAIAAGIQILCQRRGIQIKDIGRVLIAGAFGNYLDPASACAIGMLPPELEGRIVSIGNAAGEGARIAVLNCRQFERSRSLAKKTEFVELALDMGFQEVYVDEMGFPEEDD
ncbi:MAG: ASKHA domain-containing protein [Blautia sp.]|uniref:ASKHA domain-containing protein n=1 Tax=Blautia sp. TaxID=1955243 RepID=UPI0039946ECD